MYLTRNPKFVKLLYPDMIWNIRVNEKVIFLTFDDGPDPKATLDALNLLAKYQARATFFCVGEKAQKHPEIIQQILKAGHIIGNHSHKHLNGRKTASEIYISDILNAAEVLNTRLFRPPYGRITRKQVKAIKLDFKIIMWTVLPGDFDKSISRETVLNRCIKNTKSGDIIVLHDNPKFYDTMIYALEGTLDHFSKAGFKFAALEDKYL